MTDETQYIDDRDLHIYLVPYIADDIAFIVEGRNNRPLIIISMLDLEKIKTEIALLKKDAKTSELIHQRLEVAVDKVFYLVSIFCMSSFFEEKIENL